MVCLAPLGCTEIRVGRRRRFFRSVGLSHYLDSAAIERNRAPLPAFLQEALPEDLASAGAFSSHDGAGLLPGRRPDVLLGPITRHEGVVLAGFHASEIPVSPAPAFVGAHNPSTRAHRAGWPDVGQRIGPMVTFDRRVFLPALGPGRPAAESQVDHAAGFHDLCGGVYLSLGVFSGPSRLLFDLPSLRCADLWCDRRLALSSTGRPSLASSRDGCTEHQFDPCHSVENHSISWIRFAR